MAEVTQVTYVETDDHNSVVFQSGRDVIEYELNEAQDVLRVRTHRALEAAAGDGWVSGCRVTSTGSNDEVSVALGDLVGAGVLYRRGSATVISMPVAPGVGTRTDRIYLRLRETEIDDPNPLPGVGVLSRRKQALAAFVVAEGTTLTTTGNPWEGGDYYVLVATVLRTAGAPIILTGDITHQFVPTPLPAVDQITEVADGRVARLVAGTQGVVETDLDSLVVDIDVGGTYDANESFQVRANRDTLDEATVWEFNASGLVEASRTIAFKDASLVGEIPVGDDVGDNGAITLLDPFGDSNAAASRLTSLVRRANARFSATIGDGTTSYGDYNGSGAIAAALAAATAASASSVFLHLKQGNHVVTALLDFTTFNEVIVEGEGELSTTVSNTHASAVTLQATRVVLRDFSFTRTSTATVALLAQAVLAERVRFTNLGVQFGATSQKSSRFSDCQFVPPASTPAVEFTGTVSSDSLATEFLGCYFVGASGQPTVSGVASGPKTLVFKESFFTYSANSGGGDTGVVVPDAAVTAGTWWTSFENCVFTQPGSEAVVQASEDLERLSYRACRFTFGTDNSTLPFAHFYAQHLSVKDCYFDTEDSLAGVDTGAGSGIDFSATHSLSIHNVRVRRTNTKLFAGTVASTAALCLVTITALGGKVQVDGLELDYQGAVDTGANTIPRQLIYVYGDQSSGNRSSVDVANVWVNTSAAATVVLCSQAVIRFTGGYQSGVLRNSNFKFGNVAQVPAGATVVFIGGEDSIDDVVVGGPISVRDCHFENTDGYGIRDYNTLEVWTKIASCTFYNVAATTSQSVIVAPGPTAGMIQVTDCDLIASASAGITINRSILMVRGNHLRGMVSGGASGTRMVMGLYGTATSLSWVVTDNVCLANDNALDNIFVDNTGFLTRPFFKGFDTIHATPTELGTFGIGDQMQFNVALLEG